MSADSASYTNYAIADSPPEIQRLSAQYFFMKKLFDRPTLVPPAVDLRRVSKVLDVGAGTAIWALEFASVPEIMARRDAVEVFACDISTAKFPPAAVADPLGITFFQQDVTQPFPAEMRGTFDIVHMTFMVYALTMKGWKKALEHIYDVLKPGGYLLLMESDPVLYTAANPPPPKGAEHDFATCMEGASCMSKINNIFTGGAIKNDFVVGLSYRLQPLLESASFAVISSERNLTPFGKLCETRTGLRGSSLTEFRDFSVENFILIFDTLTQILMTKGELEAPRGVKITTEEDRKGLLDEFKRGVEDGALAIISEWVAQKR